MAAGMMAARMMLAMVLDMILGEPPERWHPVVWMGRAVDAAERRAFDGKVAPGADCPVDRDSPQGAEAGNGERGSTAMRFTGAATVLVLTAGTYVAARGLLKLLPPRLSSATETMLLAASLAGSSLLAAARDVEDGLTTGGVTAGRQRVARMVGRDAGSLDEAGVVRAAIESVAENTNDGVVAPMFYGFIGGAPLALTYKMVNTLDSMIGYRNERYEDFGWAAARMDDLAGFFPARLTAVAVAAASPAAGADASGAVAAWRSDAAAHRSPNAGVCESAFAGALGVSLGGRGHYGGETVEIPPMGRGNRDPARHDIGRAARLMYLSTAIFCAAGSAVAWIIRRSGSSGEYGAAGGRRNR